MSPFKSAGASVQSTTGSRGVRISGSNAGYTMFRGSVKSTSYPLHSPVSPSLPLPCVTVCHHISTGLYLLKTRSALLKPARFASGQYEKRKKIILNLHLQPYLIFHIPRSFHSQIKFSKPLELNHGH